MVFVNEVLKIIFGSKTGNKIDEENCIKKIFILYSSLNIIRVVKSRMRCSEMQHA
jgi:hypothetical protein